MCGDALLSRRSGLARGREHPRTAVRSFLYDLVMTVRDLSRDELDRIWTIDRSEVHHHVYQVVNGRLSLVSASFEVPGWDPETVVRDRVKLRECFDRGGIFRGVFDGDALVGVSVIDRKPIAGAPDHVLLFYLYVSRPARGRGVGTRLFVEAVETARTLGARGLYISSTPTQNTVDFYRHRGASLTATPDPDLLAAEPDDVHLTYPLQRGSRERDGEHHPGECPRRPNGRHGCKGR